MSKAAELANLIGNINAGSGGVNRNAVINGGMNIFQRSTSETGLGASAGYFTTDRFNFAFNGTAGRVTVTQDSSAPSGFANSTKIDVTTADTSVAAGEYFIFQQKIEGQNLQGFAKGTSDAKPFAVSFYVKGNASATYCCELFDGDNSRQASKLFNVTTDWTRVELTFDADTTGAFDDDSASSFELNIWLHAGSSFTSGTLNQTFASNDNTKRASGISSIFDSTDRTFFITGVQLEVGQNPTSFEHEPFERTLTKCQRYFQKQLAGSGSVFERFGGGFANSSTNFNVIIPMQTPMRTTPTLGTTGTASNYHVYHSSGTTTACTNLSLDANADGSDKQVGVNATVSSGLSAGGAGLLNSNNSSAAFISLDSEL